MADVGQPNILFASSDLLTKNSCIARLAHADCDQSMSCGIANIVGSSVNVVDHPLGDASLIFHRVRSVSTVGRVGRINREWSS